MSGLALSAHPSFKARQAASSWSQTLASFSSQTRPRETYPYRLDNSPGKQTGRKTAVATYYSRRLLPFSLTSTTATYIPPLTTHHHYYHRYSHCSPYSSHYLPTYLPCACACLLACTCLCLCLYVRAFARSAVGHPRRDLVNIPKSACLAKLSYSTWLVLFLFSLLPLARIVACATPPKIFCSATRPVQVDRYCPRRPSHPREYPPPPSSSA